jgi:hypothetical protein
MLSVELDEFDTIPIVVPANGPITLISNGTVRVVSIGMGAVIVPNTDPTLGRVFHVLVSVHAEVVNEIVWSTAEPAVAPVVTRITNDAETNVSPAGAGGNTNSYNAHRFDPEWT